jgi:hypothetical protein
VSDVTVSLVTPGSGCETPFRDSIINKGVSTSSLLDPRSPASHRSAKDRPYLRMPPRLQAILWRRPSHLAEATNSATSC